MTLKSACLASCAALLLGGAVKLPAYSLLDYYELKTETVAGVKPGGEIVVKTRLGNTYKGQFLERAGDTVTLRDHDGQTRTLRWSDIAWVRAQTKGVEDLAPVDFGGKHEVEPESDDAVDAR